MGDRAIKGNEKALSSDMYLNVNSDTYLYLVEILATSLSCISVCSTTNASCFVNIVVGENALSFICQQLVCTLYALS